MTVRQAQFVREYLIDGNATAAAVRSGYAASSARNMGSYLMARPAIRAALDLHRARLLRERDITADRVLEEYRRLAFSDIRGLFAPDGSMRAPHEWDDETAATVAGLEVSRTRTTTSVQARTDGQDGAASVVTEDAIVKVKRWDKVKALEVLAKYTGVLRDGTGTSQARTDTPPLDPARIARMDDTELASALALARRMDAPTE